MTDTTPAPAGDVARLVRGVNPHGHTWVWCQRVDDPERRPDNPAGERCDHCVLVEQIPALREALAAATEENARYREALITIAHGYMPRGMTHWGQVAIEALEPGTMARLQQPPARPRPGGGAEPETERREGA